MLKNDEHFNFVFSLLFIVLLILIASNFFVGFKDGLTFTSFLDLLSSSSAHFTIVQYTPLSIGGDWGIFEFMRALLNGLTSIVSFVVWIVTIIVQSAVFLVTLFSHLFFIG